MMKRALRQHHTARLKQSRRFYWGRDLVQEPKTLARLTRPSLVVAGCVAIRAAISGN